MAKTTFVNGDPQQQIAGTVVTAEFLTALNTHRHRGLDQDGDGALDYAADSGAANAYVIALSPAITAHVTGMPIWFAAANANTGASTINTGPDVKDLKGRDGAALLAREIIAGGIYLMVYTGAYYQLLNPTPIPRILHAQDQKAAGTNGGSSVAGTQIRALNTALKNSIAGASLAGNQITLPAGQYLIDASAPAFDSAAHKAYLYNVTDGTVVLVGTTENASSPAVAIPDIATTSRVRGWFETAAQKVFELRHHTSSALVNVGLGQAANLGGMVEVYSDVLIRKF